MKGQSVLTFIFLCLVSVLGCSAQQPLVELQLSNNHKLLILSAKEAAEAITSDKIDLFFDKVTASEMSIQMKRPLKEGETAESLKTDYMAFLKNDVVDFTPSELEFVTDIFEEVFKTSNAVAKDIFPRELKIIKTSMQHYGESVYYTRENCIIIPANELNARNKKEFTSTMYHELFHVYSRLNPEKSKMLYGLIGFEPIGFQNLLIPKPLADRLLLNPDGVDFAQRIALKTDAGTIHAIPVIYSNNVGFTASKPEFFGYLEFNLFQVEKEGEYWNVVTAEDGFSSTLDIKKLPDFFRQIKDNTHYIIHPDEVLADNFSFVMMGKSDPTVSAKFSKEGKGLMSDVEEILKGKTLSSLREGRGIGNGSNR